MGMKLCIGCDVGLGEVDDDQEGKLCWWCLPPGVNPWRCDAVADYYGEPLRCGLSAGHQGGHLDGSCEWRDR